MAFSMDSKEDSTEAHYREQVKNEILISELGRLLQTNNTMLIEIQGMDESVRYVLLKLMAIETQLKMKRSPDNQDEIMSLKEQFEQKCLLQNENMSLSQKLNLLRNEVFQYEENKDVKELEGMYKKKTMNNQDTTLTNSKSVNCSEKLPKSPEPAITTESLQSQIDELNDLRNYLPIVDAHSNEPKVESLSEQLLEAQRTALLNRNEAEIFKEKFLAIRVELEKTKLQSNCSLEELNNEVGIEDLQVQLKKLPAENSQKQQKLEQINQTGLGRPANTREIINHLLCMANKTEKELVVVKKRYKACNKKNKACNKKITKLETDLSNLRQDYEAVVNQPFFFVQVWELGV